MKLIRLATDNDGLFQSAFGNDMIIEPNSKMALLNLTFQTDYTVLSVNDTNNDITFKSNSELADTESSSVLNSLNYTNTTYENFISDLELALNQAIADDDFENCMSSQWSVRTYGDKKRLEYRYAPFFNPLNMYLNGSASKAYKLMSYDETLFNVTTSGTPLFRTTIKKSATAVATTDRTCAMTTYAKMSIGNGLLLIRPVTSINNASGLQDNGFGIGLSKSNLRNPDIYQIGDDIPADRRNFEIRYNRPTETYKYIDDNSIEKDSTVSPVLVNGGTVTDHDIIYYKVYKGNVEGGVLQLVGGTLPANVIRSVFFSVPLNPNDELYPYLYLRGATANISVDTFNYSLDPWINQNYVEDATNDSLDQDPEGWAQTGLDTVGYPPNAWMNSVLSIYTAGNIFYGTGVNAFPLPTPGTWQQTKEMELTLHSDIWNHLGFTDIQSNNYITRKINIGIGGGNKPVLLQCWSWFLGNQESLLSNSDNYLIESMTLPLDSYDASQVSYPQTVGGYLNPATDKQGRRKNILMTIPVNDNNNNLVEYESNTPIFIDIGNVERINQKNLNFRILNKNFDSIKQSGETAIMTILIANKDE